MTLHNQNPSAWDSTASRMGAVMNDYEDDDKAFSSTTSPMTAPTSSMIQTLNALKPVEQMTTFLDTGCGPGTVYRSLFSTYQIPKDARLIAADFSPAWIESVQKLKDSESNSPWKQVQPLVQDAMDLKDIEDGSISHCTAGFVLFMLKDPSKALQEIHRVLQTDGIVSVSSWKTAKWIDAMNEVPGDEEAVLPAAWRSKESIKTQLEQAGFKEVQVSEVETAMGYQRAADTCDFLWNLPSMKDRWENMQQAEQQIYKSKMLQKMIELGGEGPSFLTGTAIVAWAKK